MFIDVTILLTCLNFDIDIESTTIFIKLLNYRYIFGILHITTHYMVYSVDIMMLMTLYTYMSALVEIRIRNWSVVF